MRTVAPLVLSEDSPQKLIDKERNYLKATFKINN